MQPASAQFVKLYLHMTVCQRWQAIRCTTEHQVRTLSNEQQFQLQHPPNATSTFKICVLVCENRVNKAPSLTCAGGTCVLWILIYPIVWPAMKLPKHNPFTTPSVQNISTVNTNLHNQGTCLCLWHGGRGKCQRCAWVECLEPWTLWESWLAFFWRATNKCTPIRHQGSYLKEPLEMAAGTCSTTALMHQRMGPFGCARMCWNETTMILTRL